MIIFNYIVFILCFLSKKPKWPYLVSHNYWCDAAMTKAILSSCVKKYDEKDDIYHLGKEVHYIMIIFNYIVFILCFLTPLHYGWPNMGIISVSH